MAEDYTVEKSSPAWQLPAILVLGFDCHRWLGIWLERVEQTRFHEAGRRDAVEDDANGD